ncbi:TPA: replicative DNA helicase [Candidatus Poribacteria bacterium]|nr:replicative DNA helicase [Candidatus Poribacteria bacterium]
MGSVRLDRVPPQNIDAERSVLGAMLLSEDGGREAIPKVIEILGDDPYGDIFYKEAHQKIYNAILNLFERNEPADQVTVTKELMRTGDLEKVGDVAYIDEMIDSVPTAANVVHYANIVKEEALRRKLIRASVQIYNDSFDSTEDIDMLLDNAERIVLDIRKDKASRGFIHVRKTIKQTLDVIQELYNRKEHVIGTPSGFTEFDMATSGFQPSDFIIVAGRPGMGKSMFVQNIAQHVAGEHKIPVGFFSLEMSYQQILLRMLSAEANVDFQRLRTGFLSDPDWPKLTLAAGKIYEYPMLIDDTPGISVMELRAKARRMKAEYNVGLIIIDYLQLMQSRTRSENRQQEISEISRSLKGLARELNIPIIACSQLSRAPESRPDKRPQLSDLRESGAIEQDSDLVVFLYREEYYEREPSDKPGEAEVIIGKQRNGPTCTIKLAFRANCMRFDNLDRRFKSL